MNDQPFQTRHTTSVMCGPVFCITSSSLAFTTLGGRLRFLAYVLLSMILSACATPNLENFSKSTTEMQQIFEASAPMIISHMSQVEAKQADDDTRESLQGQREELTQAYVEAIKAAQILTAYSNAVNRVSSTGEKGGEAIASIVSSLNSLQTVAAQPDITSENQFISENTSSLLDSLVSKIQGAASNAKLYEIMSKAQPELDSIVVLIQQVGKTGTDFINEYHDSALDVIDENLINDHKAFLAFSKQIADSKAESSYLIRSYAEQCDTSVSADNDRICQCKKDTAAETDEWQSCTYQQMNTEVKNRQAYFTKLNKQATELQAFVILGHQGFEAEARSYEETRDKIIMRFKVLDMTATRWNNDHRDVIAYLKKCKGVSGIFQSECDFFSASNLQLGLGVLTELGLMGITP